MRSRRKTLRKTSTGSGEMAKGSGICSGGMGRTVNVAHSLNKMLKHACKSCHSEPFAVILSAAKGLPLPAQGKLREESRPENE